MTICCNTTKRHLQHFAAIGTAAGRYRHVPLESAIESHHETPARSTGARTQGHQKRDLAGHHERRSWRADGQNDWLRGGTVRRRSGIGLGVPVGGEASVVGPGAPGACHGGQCHCRDFARATPTMTRPDHNGECRASRTRGRLSSWTGKCRGLNRRRERAAVDAGIDTSLYGTASLIDRRTKPREEASASSGKSHGDASGDPLGHGRQWPCHR
jgi:hypothetical protein